jgi:hypothetical protein
MLPAEFLPNLTTVKGINAAGIDTKNMSQIRGNRNWRKVRKNIAIEIAIAFEAKAKLASLYLLIANIRKHTAHFIIIGFFPDIISKIYTDKNSAMSFGVKNNDVLILYRRYPPVPGKSKSRIVWIMNNKITSADMRSKILSDSIGKFGDLMDQFTIVSIEMRANSINRDCDAITVMLVPNR